MKNRKYTIKYYYNNYLDQILNLFFKTETYQYINFNTYFFISMGYCINIIFIDFLFFFNNTYCFNLICTFCLLFHTFKYTNIIIY